eukprot:11187187-Lingulodinium_polyedra.AAC.1
MGGSRSSGTVPGCSGRLLGAIALGPQPPHLHGGRLEDPLVRARLHVGRLGLGGRVLHHVPRFGHRGWVRVVF